MLCRSFGLSELFCSLFPFPSLFLSPRELDLRRRRREDARNTTESKVQEIKRKVKEAEDWQQTKASIMQKVVPFCVGLVMVSAAGIYYYRAAV